MLPKRLSISAASSRTQLPAIHPDAAVNGQRGDSAKLAKKCRQN